MKRKKVESKQERRFVTAMIVSTPFLAGASRAMETDLFERGYLRRIVEWCMDYHAKYGEAPEKHVEHIYHSWAEQDGTDEEEASALYDFLSELSQDYEAEKDLNVPYLLDSFGKWVSLRKAEQLRDDLEYALAQGDVGATNHAVQSYRSVDLTAQTGFDPLNDGEAWDRAFAEPLEPLISFPGDAGTFLNRALTRDALVGIQGPEKRGKTFWCLEFAFRALRNRKKVALFETGDLSEGQLLLRLGVRLTACPLWEDQLGAIKVPKEISVLGEGDYDVRYEEGVAKRTVDRMLVEKASAKFRRGCGLPDNRPYIMASTHATRTLNVRGIQDVLGTWEDERRFVPDVIIIDYADILAPERGADFRHQVNETWMALRQLSQERHCLVIVPTQANKEANTRNTQDTSSVSEDKRKRGHVTGLLGLNQTEEEKESQIMRLNWIDLREAPYLTSKCLTVGQCLPLGRAFCCGTL